jgi:CxxC motif-containing protein
MTRTLTCIECPKGCRLTVETDGSYVLSVTGNQCPKGEKYARQEVENPLRVLTTSVLTEGLDLKMLPVKTSGPIPKAKILEVMPLVLQIRVKAVVKTGDIIQNNFAGLGVDLVATRTASKLPQLPLAPSLQKRGNKIAPF